MSPTPSERNWTELAARVLEHLPSRIVILTDERFTIRWSNAFAAEVFGYPRGAAIGRSMADFVHPDDLAGAVDEMRRMRAEAAEDFEVASRDADGRGTVRVFAADGRVVPVEFRILNFLAVPGLELLGLEGRVVRPRSSLATVLDPIGRGRPLPEVFDALIRYVEATVGPGGCWIVRWSDDGVDTRGSTPLPFDPAALRAHRDAEASFAVPLVVDTTDIAVGHPIPALGSAGSVGVLVARLRNVIVPLGSDEALAGAARLAAVAVSVHEQTASLRRAATVDALTGLANRRQFDEWLDTISGPCGVLVVDVDGLKPINDRYGHAAGDVALREVARRLEAALRTTDRPARVGGDEFVVLCPDDATASDLDRLAERVLARFAEPVDLGAAVVPVTVSIGVEVRSADEPLHDVVARADQALYERKHGRRGPAPVARPATAARRFAPGAVSRRRRRTDSREP